MTQLKLRSGFTFDVTNLYGPNAVTEDEVKAFAPVYTKAHEAVMNMRKTGIMPGHLSKDGEPEEVLFPQLPYIEDGNINSPERIFALEELAQTPSYSSASAVLISAARSSSTSSAANFGTSRARQNARASRKPSLPATTSTPIR